MTDNVESDQISRKSSVVIRNEDATRIEPFTLEDAAQDDQPPVRSKWRLFIIMVSLFASLFIAALDQTIMATAIPSISADLHSSAGYTWIGGAYLLANAAAAPIWSKLSDIWGRKPILLATVAWFFASSILCAMAKDMTMLIVGRALQGTAGGGLMQMVMITISDIFSMRNRTLYLGFLEGVWCIAGGVGPLLGGAFTQYATWRWTYWINLPISGPTFILLWMFLDVHNPRTSLLPGLLAIDWIGCLSILGVTLMLLLGLNFGGETFAWDSPTVICLLVFGVVMIGVFIVGEKKVARYPLMPMALFGNKSNIASLIVGFLHGWVFIAGEYYLPLYFQSVLAASPLRSGILLLPLTISEALMGIATGIIIHRSGRYRELIWFGLALMALGTGLYIRLTPSSSTVEIVMFELVAGVGAGALFEPPLIALQVLVSQQDTATATATFGFVRNIGTSMSIVVGGVIFQNSLTAQTPRLLKAGLPANVTKAFAGPEAVAHLGMLGELKREESLLLREAFAVALRNMWILYSCVAVLGLICSALVVQKTLSREHVETRTGLGEKGQKMDGDAVVA